MLRTTVGLQNRLRGACPWPTLVVVTNWFARLNLSDASEAQQRVVQGVVDLLDELQPARLDTSRSVVERAGGETWVKLRHDAEPWLEIEFVVNDDWVNFYGVMEHDEAYSLRPEPPDGWEAETIDVVSDLLQSTFTREFCTRRGKPWREKLIISAPYDRTSTELKSLAAVLPLGGRAQHPATHSASFECHGSRPRRGESVRSHRAKEVS